MSSLDWPVWPIFIVQALTLLVLLLPKNWQFLGVSPRFIVMGLLMVIAILILISLYHDSTTALHLYF